MTKNLWGVLFCLTCGLGLQANTNSNSYLVIGGGYQPSSSQLALELNVKRFQQLASERLQKERDKVKVLFGAGQHPGQKDVIVKDPKVTDDEFLFSQLFMFCQNDVECYLRPNELENVSGSMSKQNILNTMDSLGRELSANDKFRFYYTGHGSSVSETDFTKNFLALWGDEQLSVQEFTEKLDRFPASTPIQVLMVQCYSGGFAQMNYERGENRGRISQANRCGFFSQVPDRVAAGCSPDINDQEEYSPYFFSAIQGKNARGNIVNADYSGDGKVTSDEAHAYVVLTENSIDVPTTTSSQFLREQGFDVSSDKERGWESFRSYIKAKPQSAVESAVLEGLIQQLGSSEAKEQAAPLPWIKSKVAQLTSDEAKAKDKLRSQVEGLLSAMREVSRDLYKTHKAFSSVYRKGLNNEIPNDPDVVQAREAFFKHPRMDECRKQYKAVMNAQKDLMTVLHSQARWERLQYLLETQLLEESLNKSGSQEARDKYSALKKCESDSFFPERSPSNGWGLAGVSP